MKDIKVFVLNKLQENYPFPKDMDEDSFNYVEEGYVTSLGMIQFVIELEEEFNIHFSEEELASEEFHIVGKLLRLIKQKIS